MVGDEVEKVVSDPVHGSIPLTKIEVQVMQTQVFQRLRRVKQLGLAHYVYPSADYSRLSHSLGVCHITGLILDSLVRARVDEAKKHWQWYRLAALLDDIGHYPLSHCTEEAVGEYYGNKSAASKLRKSTDADEEMVEEEGDSEAIKHESVSEMVLENDPELRSVIESGGFDPKGIASIFLRQAPHGFPLSNLISSDLDADRFDYLLRSARATGLPYGAIDLTYLLSQLVPDDRGNICISYKGMRAAEHFLLCRYFDYQQVVYHKAVVGLEQVAQQVIKQLFIEGRLDYSRKSVLAAIQADPRRIEPDTESWLDWDDDSLSSKILLLNRTTTDSMVRLKTKALVDRIPPALVVDLNLVTDRDDETNFNAHRENMLHRFRERSQVIGIVPEQCVEWVKTVNLTSVASKVPVTGLKGAFEDELEKSIRIVRRSGEKSTYLFKVRSSLISAMDDKTLCMYRIYVVAHPEQRDAVKALSRDLETDLAN